MNLDFFKLGMPWKTQDPFLFCVYHLDTYPIANNDFGPLESLAGRNLGNDFVTKNGYRMYHGETVPGFPAHPHRGFETFTVVRQGMVDHSDSLGGLGRYGDGDAQWMTAGRGVQHAEMFPLLNQQSVNIQEIFQIWINLPSKNKMCEPAYKMIWNEDLKIIENEGVKITYYMGDPQKELNQAIPQSSWAAQGDNCLSVELIELDLLSTIELPAVPNGVNRSLYFYESHSDLEENNVGKNENNEPNTINDLEINGVNFPLNYGIEIKFCKSFKLSTQGASAKLLLLQSRPIEENVVQYGPFVMNTSEQIQEAFDDFEKTQFGGWPWKSHDPVHNDRTRFAQYIDGSLDQPIKLKD